MFKGFGMNPQPEQNFIFDTRQTKINYFLARLTKIKITEATGATTGIINRSN
jgi:hypothetical protein